MIRLRDIREGSVIRVRSDFGGGTVITAVIVGVEKDIKNGLPGIDYHPINDTTDGRWAYLSQITSVVTY